MLFKQLARFSVRGGLLLTALGSLFSGQVRAADNMMSDLNDFDSAALVDNPWGGVVDRVITAPQGQQWAVNEDGKIEAHTVFSPSIAVGDLNGDGLPDIVMADPVGYFWFYPNSGTPTAPKFTAGEVMPIWIGVPVDNPNASDETYRTTVYDAMNNTVPRIQLVDFTGEKRLSIVAGNYEGKLFYIHNIGSSSQPAFSMPNDLSAIRVPTYSEGHLWCNFLAPFLYDFTGSGRLDLVMGEGTYASNSIYVLTNKGASNSPIFNEHATKKVIPGYGREHLTPQVVDWNNDGKPDIIAGDRQGYFNLWLNTSPDKDVKDLQFGDTQNPQRIKFGGQQQFGTFSTIANADLTNNKLPNFIISNSDDHLSYLLNKGKPGTPDLAAPAPIAGVNPFPKIYQAPDNWYVFKAFSMPYVTLSVTNAKEDHSFKPPEGAPTLTSALKVWTTPHKHTYFQNEVYPQDDMHIICCSAKLPMVAGQRYTVSFWVKTDGDVQNLHFFLWGHEILSSMGLRDSQGRTVRDIVISKPMGTSSDWTQIKEDVSYDPAQPPKPESWPLMFHLAFNGNGGTVSVTGFQMSKKSAQ